MSDALIKHVKRHFWVYLSLVLRMKQENRRVKVFLIFVALQVQTPPQKQLLFFEFDDPSRHEFFINTDYKKVPPEALCFLSASLITLSNFEKQPT